MRRGVLFLRNGPCWISDVNHNTPKRFSLSLQGERRPIARFIAAELIVDNYTVHTELLSIILLAYIFRIMTTWSYRQGNRSPLLSQYRMDVSSFLSDFIHELSVPPSCPVYISFLLAQMMLLYSDGSSQLNVEHTLSNIDVVSTLLQHPTARPHTQIPPGQFKAEGFALHGFQELLVEATQLFGRSTWDTDIELCNLGGGNRACVSHGY